MNETTFALPMNLGELAERRNNLNEAASLYREASPGNDPVALLSLARVLYKQSKWQECVAAYERLVAACQSSRTPAELPEATVAAVAALQESGHADAARANCPILRKLFPGNPSVERFCKFIEAPWSAPAGKSPCDRLCVRLAWNAPWDTPSAPPPCQGCTRKTEHKSHLYESRPVSFNSKPHGPHPLVLMTARRPVPTLPATLESLRIGGSLRWPWPKLVVADGYLPRDNFLSDWTVKHSDSPRGSAKTFVLALEESLAACPDLELLTFAEDDVEVCLHFLDYLARVAIPSDLALVTWFTYEFPGEAKMHETASLRGWQHPSSFGIPVLARRSCGSFVLAQCVTLTRDTVDRLLRCPRVRDWPQENGHDEMPAWALGDSPYAAHFPGLAQHTGGLNSAVATNRTETPDGRDPQKGERASPYYVGKTFNAESLLPRNLP